MTKKKILLITVSFAIIAGLFCFAQKLQETYLNINNKQASQNVKQNNTNKISNTKANEVSQNKSNESKNTANEKTDNETTVSKNTEQQNTTVTEKSKINSDINKSSGKKTSNNANTAVTKPNTQTVTKNISAQAVNETPNVTIMNAITGKVILNKYVSYDNITVADVTMKILDDANINYKTSGFGSTIYFSSIDGLNEKDNGPMSGWAYYVKKSGTSAFIKPNVGAGSYILNKGDVLVWKYLANALNN